VARLESGALSLEEALAAFEEGVTLSRRCSAELEAAERRIEVLLGSGPGGAVTEPFAADAGGDAGD
jgi:exodeoxyribonuclease VII small subunit